MSSKSKNRNWYGYFTLSGSNSELITFSRSICTRLSDINPVLTSMSPFPRYCPQNCLIFAPCSPLLQYLFIASLCRRRSIQTYTHSSILHSTDIDELHSYDSFFLLNTEAENTNLFGIVENLVSLSVSLVFPFLYIVSLRIRKP